MDPFNFANNLLRLYETKVDRDRMAQTRQVAWFKRRAAGGRTAPVKDGAKLPANDNRDEPVLEAWPVASWYS